METRLNFSKYIIYIHCEERLCYQWEDNNINIALLCLSKGIIETKSSITYNDSNYFFYKDIGYRKENLIKILCNENRSIIGPIATSDGYDGWIDNAFASMAFRGGLYFILDLENLPTSIDEIKIINNQGTLKKYSLVPFISEKLCHHIPELMLKKIDVSWNINYHNSQDISRLIKYKGQWRFHYQPYNNKSQQHHYTGLTDAEPYNLSRRQLRFPHIDQVEFSASL